MRLLDVLNSTTDFFSKRGVPSPRLQAETLLARALGLPRLQLYLQFDRDLDASELDLLRPLVKRRSLREPLQYIIGDVDFCGLKLKVTPDVLIPRPETELLVEKLKERYPSGPGGLVYDVGTGSGAIALSLAQAWPGTRIIGIDQSRAALDIARENQRGNPGLEVSWKEGHLLSGESEPAALVVANLPYLTREEMELLEPEVKQEPASALFGGEDGGDLIRELVPQALKLAPALALEIGIHHGPSLKNFILEAGYTGCSLENDLTERQRFLFAVKS